MRQPLNDVVHHLDSCFLQVKGEHLCKLIGRRSTIVAQDQLETRHRVWAQGLGT